MPSRVRSAAGKTGAALGLAASLAVGSLTACAADPVTWNDAAERRLPAPPATAAAPDAAADSLVRTTVGAALPAVPPPADGPAARACPGSLRVATAPKAPAAAVWWVERPDRSALLLASRSGDGGRTWSAPVPVDTLDRSEAGCARPAPSVAVDSGDGYVHVAYSMEAPEGKGIFYAHQMDPRAGFERPQAVVYGDRPAATSVASQGNLVVVAYEDPNTGGRPFISLALSHTAGHSFAERFTASEGSMSAEHPVVSLTRGAAAGERAAGERTAGVRLALGWVERTAPRTIDAADDPRVATAPLPSGVVVRVGQLRR